MTTRKNAEFKTITIRTNGRTCRLTAIKFFDEGVQLGGDLWMAPLPHDVADDREMIERIVNNSWDGKSNAIDLDHWKRYLKEHT